MSASNWGTLPTELLQKIFENLEGYNCNEYQLVNNQWYFASLKSMYKSITIDDCMTTEVSNWERLEGFYSLVNPSYNIGYYVREIAFNSFAKNHHQLGLVMKLCPNVEIFCVKPTRALNAYITTLQKDKDLWRKLRKINSTEDNYDSVVYRLMYLFRNSLQEITLKSIPSMSTAKDEDLYDYVREFKSLKSLKITGNFLDYYLLDCEALLQHCSTNLEKLEINLHKPEYRSNPLSEAQLQLVHTYDTFPSLKALIIRSYKPQNALLDFMYLQHKFKNLEELRIYHQLGMFWDQISTSTRGVITEYVFGIPKFEMNIAININLEVVQGFFDSYIGHTEETRMMTINFTFEQSQGVTLKKHAASSTPYMYININQDILLSHIDDPDGVGEFKKIIEFTGPYLRTLNLNRGELTKPYDMRRMPNDDIQLMNLILPACPNLQDLTVDIFGGYYLKCYNIPEQPHTELHTIQFGQGTQFENDFFEALSSCLPNLKYMTVDIRRDTDCLQYNNVIMPSTNFTELVIKVTDTALLGFGILEQQEEIVVSVTTTNNEDKVFTRHYRCYVSRDYRAVYKLELVHNIKTPHILLNVTCSTLETFKLKTSRYECILQL